MILDVSVSSAGGCEHTLAKRNLFIARYISKQVVNFASVLLGATKLKPSIDQSQNEPAAETLPKKKNPTKQILLILDKKPRQRPFKNWDEDLEDSRLTLKALFTVTGSQ